MTNVLRSLLLLATLANFSVFAKNTENSAAIKANATVNSAFNQEITNILSSIQDESQKHSTIITAGEDASTDTAGDSMMRGKINWLLVIVAALLFMVIALVLDILAVVGEIKGKPVINWGSINSKLLLGFVVIGLGATVWEFMAHSKLTVNAQPAASEHGATYDNMFTITLILTGIVFVITQVLLFWYGFKYKHSEKRKALYYPDNHKLEFVWTIIPAIVLTVLVIRGLKTWSSIMNHDKAVQEQSMNIEVFGYQFGWTARYAGADNKLGAHDFRQIGVVNALGVDPNDEKAKDDIVVTELHFPVGKPVLLNFRAKDVIHSAYLPHFRVQMNVVPGLPTRFAFTPTLTTDQMREQLNNPKFDYVLLCNKICGSAHYRMRMKVVVDSPEDYAKWLAEQPKLVSSEAPAAAPAADSTATTKSVNANPKSKKALAIK